MRTLFFFLAFLLPLESQLLSAEEVLRSVPKGCENSIQQLRVGPTWVAECRDVCSAGGKRTRATETVWFSERVCVGNVIERFGCRPDPAQPGCNRVTRLTDSPLRFDCGSLGNEWSCENALREVRCQYQKESCDGSAACRGWYKEQVKRGSCRQKRGS